MRQLISEFLRQRGMREQYDRPVRETLFTTKTKLKTVYLNLNERNIMREYAKDLRAMSVAQLREELAYWAREIDFALSLRHELAHESMYFMVLDAIDEKEEKDYAKRWERVL